MRVRKNRGRTTNFIGKFPSLKLNRIILWRSLLERDYLHLLEFDPDVVYYKEQPFQIDSINDDVHNYTPDFLVERTDKRQIIEVKPEQYVTNEENAVLYLSLASVCRAKGYEFLVVTDTMVRAQPCLNNVKLLWRYARTPLTPQHQILCHNFMLRCTQANFTEVIQFFELNCIAKDVVYALMYRGALAFDITQPINSEIILFLPETSVVARKVS